MDRASRLSLAVLYSLESEADIARFDKDAGVADLYKATLTTLRKPVGSDLGQERMYYNLGRTVLDRDFVASDYQAEDGVRRLLRALGQKVTLVDLGRRMIAYGYHKDGLNLQLAARTLEFHPDYQKYMILLEKIVPVPGQSVEVLLQHGWENQCGDSEFADDFWASCRDTMTYKGGSMARWKVLGHLLHDAQRIKPFVASDYERSTDRFFRMLAGGPCFMTLAELSFWWQERLGAPRMGLRIARADRVLSANPRFQGTHTTPAAIKDTQTALDAFDTARGRVHSADVMRATIAYVEAQAAVDLMDVDVRSAPTPWPTTLLGFLKAANVINPDSILKRLKADGWTDDNVDNLFEIHPSMLDNYHINGPDKSKMLAYGAKCIKLMEEAGK